MAATARTIRERPKRRIFHATMLVTRVEHWWVEAETAAGAREAFEGGEGHVGALGARVHVELEGAPEE
jgi:hypothetical protein